MKLLFGFALVLALAFTVGACTPAADEAADEAAEAEMTLCESLDVYGLALEDAATIDTKATIDEVNASTQAVEDAWADVLVAAGDVRDARFQTLESSYAELEDAIGQVPGEATVQEAAMSLLPPINTVQAAYDEFYTLTCP